MHTVRRRDPHRYDKSASVGLVLLSMTVLGANPVQAQGTWLGAGGGVAVPIGERVDRPRGSSISLGVGHVSTWGGGWRADAEYFALPADGARRAVNGLGLAASGALYFGDETIRPYMLVGL